MRGRVAVIAMLLAAGLAVLLGAHAVPDGYHATGSPATGPYRVHDARSLAPPPVSVSSAPATKTQREPRLPTVQVLIVFVLLVGAALFALGYLIWRVAQVRLSRRRRLVAPPPPPPGMVAISRQLADALQGGITVLNGFDRRPVAEVILACWQAVHDTAVAVGIEPRPSDTPEEFVARVLRGSAVPAADLDRLAALYREARFSRHTVGEQARESARAALVAVRAGLLAAPVPSA